MERMGIDLNWYNALKEVVKMGEPYIYDGGWSVLQVEVDVYEVEKFETISRELGFMY